MSKLSTLGRDAVGRFVADPAQSFTLPAWLYYDPAVFEEEKSAIFYKTWQFVGHAEQVAKPGDYITFKLFDQNILIVRGKDNEIRAFYNVCSYRAHELLEGAGNTKVITCPYHAWSYHIDGRHRSARGSERVAGFNADEFCLKLVRIENFMNFLFVNLDATAASLKSLTGALEDQIRGLAPELDSLTFARRSEYTLKANWKNVMENFCECYHCPIRHSSLMDGCLDMSSYRIETMDIWHHHTTVSPGEAKLAYGVGEAGKARPDFGAWLLWPNICFEVYPGGYMNTFHNMPVTPELTLQRCDWYFPQSEPTPEQEEAASFVDGVREEDISIVESVQRGYHSRGYDQGRFIVDDGRTEWSEHAVHHFQGMVKKALDA